MTTTTTSNINTIYRSDLFLGKWALVTGGGTGIGLRIAKELSILGCQVIIAARNYQRLQEAADSFNGLQKKEVLVPLEINIRDSKSFDEFCGKIKQITGGELDFLV